jgi:hypothetical protein
MSNSDFNLDSAQKPFSRGNGANSCDDDSMVRGILTESMRRCVKSRQEIADELSTLVGRPVTEAMLNAYTASSKDGHRWPSAWDRAFCEVTGDFRLLREKVELAGLRVISDEEQEYLELGRQYLAQKRAAAEMERLESSITSRGKNR